MLETPISVESLSGTQHQRGLVRITIGKANTLMSPTKAREIAVYLLEAAEAAETDEAMIRFCDSMGLAEPQAVHMLRSLRTERDKARQRNKLEQDGETQ